MQVKMCSRCGKNVAVVFITKMEGNETKNEGLCLKCARELHIKPVEDMMDKMGISDEDLDSLSGDMMNALNGVESLMDINGEPDDSEDDGKTATFPFLNRLFGGQNGQNANPPEGGADAAPAEPGGRGERRCAGAAAGAAHLPCAGGCVVLRVPRSPAARRGAVQRDSAGASERGCGGVPFRHG